MTYYVGSIREFTDMCETFKDTIAYFEKIANEGFSIDDKISVFHSVDLEFNNFNDAYKAAMIELENCYCPIDLKKYINADARERMQLRQKFTTVKFKNDPDSKVFYVDTLTIDNHKSIDSSYGDYYAATRSHVWIIDDETKELWTKRKTDLELDYIDDLTTAWFKI